MSEFSDFLQKAKIESYSDKIRQALGGEGQIALQGFTSILSLQTQMASTKSDNVKGVLGEGIRRIEDSILSGLDVEGFGIKYTHEEADKSGVDTMWMGKSNSEKVKVVDLSPYVTLRET